MNPQPNTQEVIVYRNPWEQWYWHNLGEVWTFIGLLALAIYVVFWPFVFMKFRKMDPWDVPNNTHAFVLTLFWPITLPIVLSSRPH